MDMGRVNTRIDHVNEGSAFAESQRRIASIFQPIQSIGQNNQTQSIQPQRRSS